MEYATPALQVVIVPYQLGEHKRAVYWAIALASIVTLERCRRSCGGALSNLHRAVLTYDALPIATDRPMGGRFPWRYSKSDF